MTEQAGAAAAADREEAPDPGAVRQWWRRPRWWGVTAAAVVALTGASVAIAVAVIDDTPEAVVKEYLRTVRAGDAAAARAYAEAMDGFGDASAELLVPEAMSVDWTVTRLIRRHDEDDEPATVDVVLTAADSTAREGRFELARDGDTWTILNPVVKVDFSLLPMRYVELNGAIRDAEVLWLFPGAYQAYRSGSDLVQVSAPTYVAVPGTDARYLPEVTLTDAGLDAAHAQIGEWVDGCAATAEPFPDRCPFSAGSPDERTIDVDRDTFSADGSTVAWEVVSYPRVRLVQGGDGAFLGQLVAPGEVRVAGTGTPRYGEGDRQAFRGWCGIPLDGLRATLTSPGAFAFDVDPLSTWYTCSSNRFG